MTQLKELRKQAKDQGLRGYSTMRKEDLELLLEGKPVPKRLRKNQVSVGVQTEFLLCKDCELKRVFTRLHFQADAIERRKIAEIDDMRIDMETGKVLGYEVDYVRYR